jgi:predicted GNAT family acetyltransferase
MDPHSNIFHNTAQLRFELTNSAGTAILEYHLDGSIMTIHHTFVPA